MVVVVVVERIEFFWAQQPEIHHHHPLIQCDSLKFSLKIEKKNLLKEKKILRTILYNVAIATFGCNIYFSSFPIPFTLLSGCLFILVVFVYVYVFGYILILSFFFILILSLLRDSMMKIQNLILF